MFHLRNYLTAEATGKLPVLSNMERYWVIVQRFCHTVCKKTLQLWPRSEPLGPGEEVVQSSRFQVQSIN